MRRVLPIGAGPTIELHGDVLEQAFRTCFQKKRKTKNSLGASHNSPGTPFEPSLKASPDHPKAYLGKDPIASSCWGKKI